MNCSCCIFYHKVMFHVMFVHEKMCCRCCGWKLLWWFHDYIRFAWHFFLWSVWNFKHLSVNFATHSSKQSNEAVRMMNYWLSSVVYIFFHWIRIFFSFSSIFFCYGIWFIWRTWKNYKRNERYEKENCSWR